MTSETTPKDDAVPGPPKRRRRTAGSLASSMASAPLTEPTKTTPAPQVADDAGETSEESYEKAPERPAELPAGPVPVEETAEASPIPENGAEAPKSSGLAEAGGAGVAHEHEPAEVVLLPAEEPEIPVHLLVRPKQTMDPTLHEMYTALQQKKLKSLNNIRDMLAQRQGEYQAVVREARNAGYPENDIERMARQWEWEPPKRH